MTTSKGKKTRPSGNFSTNYSQIDSLLEKRDRLIDDFCLDFEMEQYVSLIMTLMRLKMEHEDYNKEKVREEIFLVERLLAFLSEMERMYWKEKYLTEREFNVN